VKPKLGQVADFLRGCISSKSVDHIGVPDHLRALFESPSVLQEIIPKMPRVDVYGLLGDTSDPLKGRLAQAAAPAAPAAQVAAPAALAASRPRPTSASAPPTADAPLPAADRGKRKERDEGAEEGDSDVQGPSKVIKPLASNPFAKKWGGKRRALAG
jgi:hypothetical protein